MKRDAIMAKRIVSDARAHGFRVWQVDHSTDFEALYAELLAGARGIVGGSKQT
jgi:hypothetical protein